jgi:hypothetical protein
MEGSQNLTSPRRDDPQAELRKLWRSTWRAYDRARDELLARGVPSDLIGQHLPRIDWGVFAPLRCGARTKGTGAPCKLTTIEAGGRCKFHGGLSTGPKTPEGRARAAQNGRRTPALQGFAGTCIGGHNLRQTHRRDAASARPPLPAPDSTRQVNE